ncbi:MAG: LuxR C-terminal-related transcriptional regulator [Cytophagales bacterium]
MTCKLTLYLLPLVNVCYWYQRCFSHDFFLQTTVSFRFAYFFETCISFLCAGTVIVGGVFNKIGQAYYLMEGIALLASIYILVVSILRMKQGDVNGTVFLLALALLLVAGATHALTFSFKILPHTVITDSALLIGSALEILLIGLKLLSDLAGTKRLLSVKNEPIELSLATFNRYLQNTSVDQLTEKEWEVLCLIEKGMSNKQIADHLQYISIEGVKSRIKKIYTKLNIIDKDEGSRLNASELLRRAKMYVNP